MLGKVIMLINLSIGNSYKFAYHVHTHSYHDPKILLDLMVTVAIINR